MQADSTRVESSCRRGSEQQAPLRFHDVDRRTIEKADMTLATIAGFYRISGERANLGAYRDGVQLSASTHSAISSGANRSNPTIPLRKRRFIGAPAQEIYVAL